MTISITPELIASHQLTQSEYDKIVALLHFAPLCQLSAARPQHGLEAKGPCKLRAKV